MPGAYKAKGNQRCSLCGRRGHNEKNPNCPINIAKRAAAMVLHALARELGAESADPAGRMVRALPNGGFEVYVTAEDLRAAAARAAAKVAS